MYAKIQQHFSLTANDTVAQAYLENYAHRLFTFADQQDRASNFGKNVIKSFYVSAMIYDILTVLGELSEEAKQNQKYAKWKAAYIHNCLKNGEQPHPGPLPDEGEDELLNLGPNPDQNPGAAAGSSSAFGWNTNPYANQPAVSPPKPSSQDTPANNFNQDPFLNIRAPSPPKDPEEKNPGGFVAFDPVRDSNIPVPSSQSSATVSAEMMMKAQKYCKYAGSALTYDDVPTAIDNLQKALRVLTTGQDA
jgi:vacuolar protein sorting-associated protein VTA1